MAHLVTYQSVPLSKATNGIEGELQLMQDARLTPSLRTQLWGTGPSGSDAAEPPLNGGPLLNAEVRIVNSDGKPVVSEELERPLTKLEAARLYSGSGRTYLVTVDYSAGWGSYSGPITFLVEITDGRLRWLDRAESATGKRERIALMESLKTEWKIVAASSGSGKEILMVACRPTLEPGNAKFTLLYSRYFFDGKSWVELVREQEGYWESQDDFPDRSLFP